MTEKTPTISQAAAPPPPGHYHLESGRGTIRASARAMFGLFTVKGTFRIRDGEVCIAEDPAACTARATIDASSYDSGNARRDRDVSSPALLDAGRFPDITFTGTGARAEHDSWVMDGSVSAHGATDTIQVRVSEARAEGDGAYFLAGQRQERNGPSRTAFTAAAARAAHLIVDGEPHIFADTLALASPGLRWSAGSASPCTSPATRSPRRSTRSGVSRRARTSSRTTCCPPARRRRGHLRRTRRRRQRRAG